MTRHIRRRLLILSVAAVLPFAAVVFYLVASENRRAEEQALKNAATVARLIASKASLIVEHSGQLLASRAQSTNTATLLGPNCQRELNELLKLHSLYGFAGVCDRNGKMVCSTASAAGSQLNFSDREHFQRALATGQVTISGLLQSRLTGRKVVVLLQPIFEGPRLLGVLGAELDLGWMDEALRDAKLPAGTVISLLDGKGFVFASYPEPGFAGRSFAERTEFTRMAAISPEGSTRVTGHDSIERLAAYARIKNVPNGEGAYVSVSIPSAALEEAAARTVREGLLAFAVVLTFSLVAIWLGSKFLVLPQLRALHPGGQLRKLVGHHRAARGGEQFTYEVAWHESGTVLIWDAKIRLGERLVGMPSGEVLRDGASDPAALVKREVEAAIDHRLTVD